MVLMKCGRNSIAQQWLHGDHKQLVTAVSGRAYLQSPGERRSQEAASQLLYRHVLQLVTMESNFDFNKEVYFRLRRTYSLQ